MLNDSHPYSSLPDSRPHFLPLPHAAAPLMDHQPSSSCLGGPTTPRRQLQGPRPPRLNVRTESHAIKKPSTSDRMPARAPVIIYDASPKVIHADPSEFMALVQRLTGPGSVGAPPPPPPHETHTHLQADDTLGQAFLPPELLLSPSAAMSPAARLATIERSVRPMPDDDGTLAAVLGPARPGVLSPLPSSLPPAAASGSFSPLPFDVSSLSWINELSPILRAEAGTSSAGGPYYSDPFVPSPRNLLATPTTCAEFFGSVPDF